MQRLMRQVEKMKHISEKYRESLLGKMGDTLQHLKKVSQDQRREIFTNGENGNWIINVAKVKTRSEQVSRYKQSWRVGGARTGVAGQARFAAMIESVDDEAADYLRELQPSDEAFDIAENLGDYKDNYSYQDILDAYNRWLNDFDFKSKYPNPTDTPDIADYD